MSEGTAKLEFYNIFIVSLNYEKNIFEYSLNGLCNTISLLLFILILSFSYLKKGLKKQRVWLAWIVSVILVFLFLTIYHSDKHILSENIRHWFGFVNVTNWDYKPFGVKKYGFSYIPLFIGRIFIAYGIYQTIQAFRKFSKN